MDACVPCWIGSKKHSACLPPCWCFLCETGCTLSETNYHRHAVEIARGLNINLYDGVACVSGDGIPTEVSAALD